MGGWLEGNLHGQQQAGVRAAGAAKGLKPAGGRGRGSGGGGGAPRLRSAALHCLPSSGGGGGGEERLPAGLPGRAAGPAARTGDESSSESTPRRARREGAEEGEEGEERRGGSPRRPAPHDRGVLRRGVELGGRTRRPPTLQPPPVASSGASLFPSFLAPLRLRGRPVARPTAPLVFGGAPGGEGKNHAFGCERLRPSLTFWGAPPEPPRCFFFAFTPPPFFFFLKNSFY